MQSEAKHTPGPWKYHTESYRNLIAGPDRLRVADVWTSDRPDTERMANARLIAAAPDLLVELQAALDVLKEYREYGEAMREMGRGFSPTDIYGRSIDSTILGLETAIRKATGNA